jgi:hypothetical protein
MAGHSHHDKARQNKEEVDASNSIESARRQYIAPCIFGFDNGQMRQDHQVRCNAPRRLNCQQLRHLSLYSPVGEPARSSERQTILKKNL